MFLARIIHPPKEVQIISSFLDFISQKVWRIYIFLFIV